MKGVTTCQGNERPMSASPAGWAPAGAARRRIVMPASKSIDEGPAEPSIKVTRLAGPTGPRGREQEFREGVLTVVLLWYGPRSEA